MILAMAALAVPFFGAIASVLLYNQITGALPGNVSLPLYARITPVTYVLEELREAWQLFFLLTGDVHRATTQPLRTLYFGTPTLSLLLASIAVALFVSARGGRGRPDGATVTVPPAAEPPPVQGGGQQGALSSG